MAYFRNQDEVAHAWAHQTHTDGRCGGSLSFDGDTLYSYSAPIGRWVIPHGPIPRDLRQSGKTRVLLYSREDYSVTTGRHVSMMHFAVPNVETISIGIYPVDGLSTTPRNLLNAVRFACDKMDEQRATLCRARVSLRARKEYYEEGAAHLATLLRIFRRELSANAYDDYDTPHTGIGYPVSRSGGRDVGTPRDWMKRARKLVKTNGWSCAAQAAKFQHKADTEAERAAAAHRRNRQAMARNRKNDRDQLRILRRVYGTGKLTGEELHSALVANELAFFCDMQNVRHAIHSTERVYGWSVTHMPKRWRARLLPAAQHAAILREREIEAGRIQREKIAALRGEERRRALEGESLRWKAGEIATLPNDAGTFARVSADGSSLETNHYARVPIAHARRLARLIKRREVKRGDRVGHFAVSDVGADVLTIGCHKFDKAETDRLVELLTKDEG